MSQLEFKLLTSKSPFKYTIVFEGEKGQKINIDRCLPCAFWDFECEDNKLHTEHGSIPSFLFTDKSPFMPKICKNQIFFVLAGSRAKFTFCSFENDLDITFPNIKYSGGLLGYGE